MTRSYIKSSVRIYTRLNACLRLFILALALPPVYIVHTSPGLPWEHRSTLPCLAPRAVPAHRHLREIPRGPMAQAPPATAATVALNAAVREAVTRRASMVPAIAVVNMGGWLPGWVPCWMLHLRMFVTVTTQLMYMVSMGMGRRPLSHSPWGL